uniref:Uncharacterized protein n=1 Tax=Anguilla anguilla TaxID=7936 RepID=A0A0E9UDD1_ANGAN
MRLISVHGKSLLIML